MYRCRVSILLIRYSEIGLKSTPVRRRFENQLKDNILTMLAEDGVEALVSKNGARFYIEATDPDAAVASVRRVFGVGSISVAEECASSHLEDICAKAAEYSLPRLAPGQSFAVKARREGSQGYTSMDVGREAGSAIFIANEDKGVKVDLTNPDVVFYVEVRENRAFVFGEYVRCHAGLPVGSQGKVLARRPDLLVFQGEAGESRLIGVKGTEGYYACYQEVASDKARVLLARDRIQGLHIDPVFTSLLALERRLIARDSLILHCAYMVYQREAILFSAPSETGKTTQANLWEKYRGSRTVNGDRALLGRKDGRWTAQGWPVCGTSEVCHNEDTPIRAVVMLSQAKENHAERMTPGKAFPLLYSQITVNKWNVEDHVHTLDLIEEFLGSVPVIHLGCTISEEAVTCLERALSELEKTGA